MSQDKPQGSGIEKAQKASKAVNHDPFERINNLPPEQYEIVLSMLKAHSPYAVAKTIQQDWEQCLDVTELTLAHQLERFRAAKIPLEQLMNPYVIARLTEQVRRNVNVISEQSTLIEMQMERLRQVRLQEVESGVLSPMVDKQTSLLNRLLKNYGDIAFKCGLLNHYAADFRKIAEREQQQLEFCLPDMFFSIFRDLYAEDPDNFIENMRQSLGW